MSATTPGAEAALTKAPYFPVLLVVVVAIAPGIVVLVREIRGKDENPSIKSDRETK